jgi:hypothetical protein
MTNNVDQKEYMSSPETLNFCRARHGRMALLSSEKPFENLTSVFAQHPKQNL